MSTCSDFPPDVEESRSPLVIGTNYGTVVKEKGPYGVQKSARISRGSIMKDIGKVANIMSIILTCNMFSFPWSFFQTGIIYGVLILTASSAVSCATALSLHRSQQQLFMITGKVANYCDVAQHYLGGGVWLSSSIQIATAISCFGGCIGFYIFIGQILSQLLEITLRTANIMLFLPLVFLSLSRTFKELSIYAIFSVFSFILVIVVMYQHAFLAWYSSVGTPPASTSSPYTTPDGRVVIEFVGNATFLFAIHYCLLSQAAEDLEENMLLTPQEEASRLAPVERKEDPAAELPRARSKTSDMHITVSFVLSTVVSVLVGITGHFFDGGAVIRDAHGQVVPGCELGVCENVILNIPPGHLRCLANLVLVTSTMISYTLLMVPVREYIEAILLDLVKPDLITPHRLPAFSTRWCVDLMRVFMVGVTAVIATEAPYFADVLSTVGGVSDSYLAYILPALIMIAVLRRPSFTSKEGKSTGLAVCLFLFILVGGVILACSTIYGLVETCTGVT